jgi:esterase/lipase superfamily enzyme
MKPRTKATLLLLWAALLLIAAYSTPSASAQDIPLDEEGFTTFVAERLRRELPDIAVTHVGKLKIKVENAARKSFDDMNLDRLFTSCTQNTDRCSESIDLYVKGIVQTSHQQPTPIAKSIAMTDKELSDLFSKINATMEKVSTALEKSSSHEKDSWDKFDLLTKFVATVLLVAIGGVFTFLYKAAQDKHEETLRIQQQRVHKLDVVSKFMPFIAAEKEEVRRTAIFAVQDLIGTETAIKLALITVNPETPTTIKALGERAEEKKDREFAALALDQVIRSEDFYIVITFYVTDRNILDKSLGRFGAERGDISYGTTDISIPKGHRVGSVETPSALRLEFKENPTKHVVLAKTSILDETGFREAISRTLQLTEEGGIVIFVHSFNVTFDYGARRFAQLFYDLSIRAVPVLYSWPSVGAISGYMQDETTVSWSAQHIATVFRDLKEIAGDKKISVIAHGLGSQAVLPAILKLSETLSGEQKPFFDQLVFVAPDVNADVFKSQAPALIRAARRVTRYVSSEDKALAASLNLHSSSRAGLGGDQLVQVLGIDTIDVSQSETSLLGHTYYGDSISVLRDLRGVLQGLSPSQRFGLDEVSKDGSQYWILS